jgi:hypothetical protein
LIPYYFSENNIIKKKRIIIENQIILTVSKEVFEKNSTNSQNSLKLYN